MKEFATAHPWMTFFLAMAAINGVVVLVRGQPKFDESSWKPQPLPATATKGLYSVRGLMPVASGPWGAV